MHTHTHTHYLSLSLFLSFSPPLPLSLSPEVHLGLNTDLVIGREERMVRGTGSVVLEDCSFHEKTNLTEFDRDRTLSIGAQDGEVRREGEGGKEGRER